MLHFSSNAFFAKNLRAFGLGAVLCLLGTASVNAWTGGGGGTLGSTATSRGLQENTIARSALPAQALQTERQVRLGGPFPYDKDGSVFGNREKRLPVQPRGFYREYTVPTPGSRDRGARRLVCGGFTPTQPEACYYTSDHYNSFMRIVQ